MDSKIEHLHRGIETMHQWKFECVEASIWFPLGAKTTYRAYSSDKVIVFEKKSPMECLSDVGRSTGLEPIQLHVTWQPSCTSDPSRPGIEGFYLLKGIPYVEADTLPCVAFPEGATAAMEACFSEIRKKFSGEADKAILEEWNDIYKKFVPDNDDAAQYVASLPERGLRYHIPLKKFLLHREIAVTNPEWADEILLATPQNIPYVELPDILAAAAHSVRTEMNTNPMPVRIYVPTNAQLVADRNQYVDAVENYHTAFLKDRCTIPILKLILKKKTGYNGLMFPHSG